MLVISQKHAWKKESRFMEIPDVSKNDGLDQVALQPEFDKFWLQNRTKYRLRILYKVTSAFAFVKSETIL